MGMFFAQELEVMRGEIDDQQTPLRAEQSGRRPDRLAPIIEVVRAGKDFNLATALPKSEFGNERTRISS